MKKVALLLTAAVLCAPMLAFAEDATPTANDQDQIDCRRGEPITGTRLPGPTVCHTKREWNQIQQDAQKTTSEIEAKGTLHNPQSN